MTLSTNLTGNSSKEGSSQLGAIFAPAANSAIERLRRRLNKASLPEQVVKNLVTLIENKNVYNLASPDGLIKDGKHFPLPHPNTITASSDLSFDGIVAPLLNVERKNPIYCCIGLSGRSEKKGIKGQTSLGLPLDVLQLLLATVQYSRVTNTPKIFILLGDGVANANAALSNAEHGAKAIDYTARFYRHLISEILNVFGVDNHRVVLAAELANDPRHQIIQQTAQNNVKYLGIPAEIDESGIPYYVRQVADELTLRLQHGAETKISWTDGNKRSIDEQSFDNVQTAFLKHVGGQLPTLAGINPTLFFYTQPGTTIGNDANAAPYYCLGENRILLQPAETIIPEQFTKTNANRYRRIAMAAKDFVGSPTDCENFDNPHRIARYINWLIDQKLGKIVKDAHEGISDGLKGLPPVQAFLGWQAGDYDPDIGLPTRAWTNLFTSSTSDLVISESVPVCKP